MELKEKYTIIHLLLLNLIVAALKNNQCIYMNYNTLYAVLHLWYSSNESERNYDCISESHVQNAIFKQTIY